VQTAARDCVVAYRWFTCYSSGLKAQAYQNVGEEKKTCFRSSCHFNLHILTLSLCWRTCHGSVGPREKGKPEGSPAKCPEAFLIR